MVKKKNSKKRSKKNFWILGALILIIFSLFLLVFFRTGFFHKDKIDETTLERWNYDSDGFIQDAREFEINGSKENCWFLIHGYTSTPDEMRNLSSRISEEFGDYVYAVRLNGHGRTPSEVANLSLDDWYEQVSGEFDSLKKECKNVNVVGFSFGGVLATKLSEEKEIKNTYLIAPYFFATYNFYFIFPLENYLDVFSDSFVYIKKSKIAQINDPEGLKWYISYWDFPMQPVKNSRVFLDKVLSDLSAIKNPVLIQHSKNDDTANVKGSTIVFENISSDEKQLILFEKSNHVLLADYDKESAIENIIIFERMHRD